MKDSPATHHDYLYFSFFYLLKNCTLSELESSHTSCEASRSYIPHVMGLLMVCGKILNKILSSKYDHLAEIAKCFDLADKVNFTQIEYQ